MAQKGCFISIEGIEGVGKSTAVAYVQSYFEARSIPLVVTREPGGTEIAQAIREVVLGTFDETMCDDTELLLILASRAQHIHEVIAPALARGAWVLSDRYTDATYAYQGGGRGMSLARLDQVMLALGLSQYVPDKTLLLDAPYEVAFNRIKGRGHHDRIEQEKKDFFDRVRAAYLERAAADAARISVLDASADLSSVHAGIAGVLDAFCVAKEVSQ